MWKALGRLLCRLNIHQDKITEEGPFHTRRQCQREGCRRKLCTTDGYASWYQEMGMVMHTWADVERIKKGQAPIESRLPDGTMPTENQLAYLQRLAEDRKYRCDRCR